MSKERYYGGAALTGVTLAMLAWKNREEWRQANQTLDPDFDCDQPMLFGKDIPCAPSGIFNGVDAVDITLTGLAFIGLALMYGHRGENRA